MPAQFVVIVEDEPDLRDAVVEYLRMNGFDAEGASDGAQMRALIAERRPDIVILDIALPGEDGLSLCRTLRREHGCGVIMATGASQALDRVVGLEVGADDYLVKPFEIRELLARIRSVIRRLARTAAPDPAPASFSIAAPTRGAAADGADAIGFGAFRLDPRARRVTGADGREIMLTAGEFDLLQVFAERPRRVLSREALSSLALGKDFDPDERAIDIRVLRLRKKLEQDPARPTLIRTVRGEGYQFDPDGA
jgi:DNA-binding response OmpR family regulator